MSALLDRLPTYVKAAIWIAVAAAADAVWNGVTTGAVKVDPAWVPVINIALVALRDFARARKAA